MNTVFFPKKQYPISVLPHKNGADVTITQTTDTLQSQSRYAVEYYCHQHNLRVGAYIGKHFPADATDIQGIERNGAIRCDYYYHSDAGSPEEAIAWFEGLTGRKPSAFSFALGNESYADLLIPHSLFNRNSNTGDNNYGAFNDGFLGVPQLAYTSENYKNRASTTRWFDNDMTWEQVEDVLEDTINSGGWFRDFTHWHWLRPGRTDPVDLVYKQGELYTTLKNKVAALGKAAHFCGSGEAAEYMVYRTLITDKACYLSSAGTVNIALEVKDLLLQDRMNTPISLLLDLSSSPLASKNIKADVNCEIIKLPGNKWIVNVPFRQTGEENHKVFIVRLSEGIQEYRTDVQPTATTSIIGGELSIEADQDVIVTLFRKSAGAAEDTYTVTGRRNSLSKNHTFTGLNTTTYDYCIGLSNKFQVLNALEI